jgi:hypothetical protein
MRNTHAVIQKSAGAQPNPGSSRMVTQKGNAQRKPAGRMNFVKGVPADESSCIVSSHCFHTFLRSPNVKDEPRRKLARRVPPSELDSASPSQSSFGRTRRDSSRRWLWRLVGRLLILGTTVGLLLLRLTDSTINILRGVYARERLAPRPIRVSLCRRHRGPLFLRYAWRTYRATG